MRVPGRKRLTVGGVGHDGLMYREYRPPLPLGDIVRCLWSARIQGSFPIVPDGCADLIVAGGQVFVAGPDTTAWRSTLASGTVLHGARFRPGHAPNVLGTAASDLRDRRVTLDELWGRRGREAAERLLAAPSALPAVVLDAARREAGDTGGRADPRMELLLARLDSGVSRVGEAAHDLGLGQRQLRRRFTEAVGYGPATYLRVARLQRALTVAPRVADLSALAAESGYADQAHLSRDCRDLTGLAASEYFVLGGRCPQEATVVARRGPARSSARGALPVAEPDVR
ncbi:helix-turn-helix domain-containing protein [Amycolatopsis palatopharyngis]|uniref:helix-turn-helix domain-containing protein n=1 Tax=Amycolatopsis palatopharyngis TaxID=187982 RepID=UPI001FE795D4|nr:helix-turn-helix domain-containing protein [Amycolatopsis palatopharyngis]